MPKIKKEKKDTRRFYEFVQFVIERYPNIYKEFCEYEQNKSEILNNFVNKSLDIKDAKNMGIPKG